MNIDFQYLRLLRRILEEGEVKKNRTGIDTIALAGATIEHDMSEGFPLLTTKKVAFKSIKVELEGFIKGIRSKKWFQERGCTIWNEWCNPKKVPYSHDEETKKRMLEEDDLGPIYGVQWRNFSSPMDQPAGVDQLKNILKTLESDPNDRRMICSAWNPMLLDQMALPPCHLLWQVTVIDGKLNLAWYQRSVDTPLGLPFNIASYGLLLHLLTRHANLRAGKLIGFLMDTHIYVNQIEAIKDQIRREPKELPSVNTEGKSSSIFDWNHTKTKLTNYNPHPSIKIPIAI